MKINVGGEIFITTEATLSRSAFLDTMLNNVEYKKEVDADGNLFVDKDPELFKYILKYLRTLRPVQSHFLENELLEEADYYQITDFAVAKPPLPPILLPPQCTVRETIEISTYKTRKGELRYYIDSRDFPEDLDDKLYPLSSIETGITLDSLAQAFFHKLQGNQGNSADATSTETVNEAGDLSGYYARTRTIRYVDSASYTIIKRLWSNVEKIEQDGYVILKLSSYA
jgi:hypothetical protein